MRRGVREQGWGRGMVAVAVLIWLWLAYQLFFSFSIEHGVRSEPIACDSRAFHRDASSDTSHTETERGRCAAERDWGPMLAAFLLSLPCGRGRRRAVRLGHVRAAHRRLRRGGHPSERRQGVLSGADRGARRGRAFGAQRGWGGYP